MYPRLNRSKFIVLLYGEASNRTLPLYQASSPMARNRRKQARRLTPAHTSGKCGVLFPLANEDTSFILTCSKVVLTLGSRCPKHEEEYHESIRTYTYWEKIGDTLANPAFISSGAVKRLYSPVEVEARLKLVEDYKVALIQKVAGRAKQKTPPCLDFRLMLL
ncbi:hypothetical protein QCA50_011227 [Cerrena zonata]|uniref:Uncharacterized protein n=1 Tax=Cerrena zonata TaxID=2478898 RepID=A0AAW0G405_9APHY